MHLEIAGDVLKAFLSCHISKEDTAKIYLMLLCKDILKLLSFSTA